MQAMFVRFLGGWKLHKRMRSHQILNACTNNAIFVITSNSLAKNMRRSNQSSQKAALSWAHIALGERGISSGSALPSQSLVIRFFRIVTFDAAFPHQGVFSAEANEQ